MNYYVLVLLLFIQTATIAQTQSRHIDLSAARAYIHLANNIQANNSENSQWTELFKTQGFQILIQNRVIDTVDFKKEMIDVFSVGVTGKQSIIKIDSNSYQFEYKKYLPQLNSYLDKLEKADIVDSVKQLLYPFLPTRLQADSLFPKLYYLYYGPDATGGFGLVFNDLFLSYKTDSYKFGILAAHEAFHAVLSQALYGNRLKSSIDQNSPTLGILSLLSSVSEEGVADLIDKPILEQKNSPVYKDFIALKTNDTTDAIKYIKQIDSLLTLADKSDAIWNKFNSFQQLRDMFGRNGGHVPGRFMGLIIKEGKTLQEHIQSVEDPIFFFLCYNKAVGNINNKKYPLFSNEAISYLKKLRTELYK